VRLTLWDIVGLSRGFLPLGFSSKVLLEAPARPGLSFIHAASFWRTPPPASLQDLRQVRTYQIAPFVQAECIAPRAVAVKLFLPFHHVCLAAVFLDEPADAVAAFTSALGAFDAEHVEFILDVAKHEIGPLRHDSDITHRRTGGPSFQ
jgi:hypothetical protein